MRNAVGDMIERRMNQPRRPTHRPAVESLARGLGWFSIGLGLAQILMPRPMARGLNMRGREKLLFFHGLREIATGVGLLTASKRTRWMWSRVMGDAVDMATLAGRLQPGRRLGPAVGLAAVAGVAAVDVANAAALSARDRRRARARHDYSDRSGFPRPPEQMRGAARTDFRTPQDLRADLPRAPQPQAELEL